jgi:hypothetical protein
MKEPAQEDGTISVGTSKLIFGQVPRVGKQLRKTKPSASLPLFADGAGARIGRPAPRLPLEDNTPEGLRALLAANRHYREAIWPDPYNRTPRFIWL